MKINYSLILKIILVLGIGWAIFSEMPEGTSEATIKMAMSPPLNYIFMGICLILAILFFWILIKIQIPAYAHGEEGKKYAEENQKLLMNFFDKFKFWKYFTKRGGNSENN